MGALPDGARSVYDQKKRSDHFKSLIQKKLMPHDAVFELSRLRALSKEIGGIVFASVLLDQDRDSILNNLIDRSRGLIYRQGWERSY